MLNYITPFSLPTQPNLGRTGGHTTLQRTDFGVATTGVSLTQAAGTVLGTYFVSHDILELAEFGVEVIADATAITTNPVIGLYVIPQTVPAAPLAPVTGSPAVATAVLVNVLGVVNPTNAAGCVNPSQFAVIPCLQYCNQFQTLDANYGATPPVGFALPPASYYPRVTRGSILQLKMITQGVVSSGAITVCPYTLFRTFPIEI